MNINKFENNTTSIRIPSFDGLGDIEIEVKRPQLMSMMTQGKIPNRLLGVAALITNGKSFEYKSEDEIEKAKELAEWVSFYCEICMVNPSYEDAKDSITDDQALSIYAWAVAPIGVLRSFRNKEEDDTNNRDGEVL